MTAKEDVVIVDFPARERASLGWILEESFEGWYLLHSKKTLRDIEVVRVAKSSGKPVGLRSEEHTSELQSQSNLVCRLLLEKKNTLLARRTSSLVTVQRTTCF